MSAGSMYRSTIGILVHALIERWGIHQQGVHRQHRELRLECPHERFTPSAECEPDPSVFLEDRRRDDEADSAGTPSRQNTARHAPKEKP